jgi:NADPH2:quinone reductase
MKIARAHAYGGPEVIRIDEVATPKPGVGEVLVRLDAAGVNFLDVYHRTGLYKDPLPFRMGSEGAGVVEAIGDGVTVLAPGARVAWAGVEGSYATHVVAPANRLVTVPDGVDTRVAAAAMLQGMTAHYLVRSTYPLGPNDTCLAHASAGGVGLLLCQLAKRTGARVIGTTSTSEKAALAKAAGADEIIRYDEVDFSEEVRRLTGGKGVDVVYDSVGQSTWEGSLRSLRPRGMMVTYGNSSGAVPPFAPLVLRQLGSLYVTRPQLGNYVATREELEMRSGEVLGAIAKGELHVRIHGSFPLEKAGEAQALLESRKTSGKVLIDLRA